MGIFKHCKCKCHLQMISKGFIQINKIFETSFNCLYMCLQMEIKSIVSYFILSFEPECNAELVIISRKGRSKDNPSLSDI